MDANLTLHPDMNCELFQSCKKTKYATQVTAMNNAIGFTNFQGVNAHQKIPLWIDVYLNTTGMNFQPNKCADFNQTLYGFPVSGKCSCNSCDESCTFDKNPGISTFAGFNGIIVVIVYIIVALGTTGLYFLKRKTRGRKISEAERKHTLESDVRINKANLTNNDMTTNLLADNSNQGLVHENKLENEEQI
jgi:hypothetical protein